MVRWYSPLVGGILLHGRWVRGAPPPRPPCVFLFLFFSARPQPLTPRAEHSTDNQEHSTRGQPTRSDARRMLVFTSVYKTNKLRHLRTVQ